MSDKEKNLEKKLEKMKGAKLVREYVPYAKRILSENDKKQKSEGMDYDNSDLGLSKVIDKTNQIVLNYPDVDKTLLLLKSTFKHDVFMMDLLEPLFVEQKHIDGKATERANEVIINIAKSLSLNESEKRNPIMRILKRKG